MLGLVKQEGLGTVLDDNAQSILGQGKELKNAEKPRKEDIVKEDD